MFSKRLLRVTADKDGPVLEQFNHGARTEARDSQERTAFRHREGAREHDTGVARRRRWPTKSNRRSPLTTSSKDRRATCSPQHHAKSARHYLTRRCHTSRLDGQERAETGLSR